MDLMTLLQSLGDGATIVIAFIMAKVVPALIKIDRRVFVIEQWCRHHDDRVGWVKRDDD